MMVMGNLSVLKLLQFSMSTIACTLNILSNQAQFGILKHAVNLFPRVIRERKELRQVWISKETREGPPPTCFDSRLASNPIMNILIWNCRGAMKPTFKKTVMDLVEWHQPVIFVITETRIDGPRADEIIRRLPFDGAYSTETIGHVGGIWLLWQSDFVSWMSCWQRSRKFTPLFRLVPTLNPGFQVLFMVVLVLEKDAYCGVI